MGRKKKEVIPVAPIEKPTLEDKFNQLLKERKRTMEDIRRVSTYIQKEAEFISWQTKLNISASEEK